ncbi:MAG: cellulose synthase catalytic subunit [Methanobrevibacter sp.]|jgi:cellulose synthase (UDP-forming)|nr:cellulose synthase catalytic subunit [Candidatus Methanovirga australis]
MTNLFYKFSKTTNYEIVIPSIVFILFLFFEMVIIIDGIISTLSAKMKKDLSYEVLNYFPYIDVLIVVHDEPVEILYRTVNSAVRMDYPKDKLSICLCDDMLREDMKELAKSFDVKYIPYENNEHVKAGNLNNALKQTDSPYVLLLDADMIPTEETLIRLLPFFTDQKMGYVQVPPTFYNLNLYKFNLHGEKIFPNEDDFFIRKINPGRSRTNSVLCCGSNVMLKREALKEVGYFDTSTIAEDFSTAIKMQKRKYKNLAIDETLINGLAPLTINNLFTQEERWLRGAIQVLKKNNFFLSKKLTVIQTINNLNILINWITYMGRTFFLLLPILLVLSNMFMPMQLDILNFWIFFFILNIIIHCAGGDKHILYSDFVNTVKCFHLTKVLIKEIFKPYKRFHVTPKKSSRNRGFNDHGIPHLIVLLLSIYCFFYSIILKYNPIIILWIVVNITTLIPCVLFFIGRDDNDLIEVFEIKTRIKIDNEVHKTENISLKGITINSKLGNGKEVDLEIGNNIKLKGFAKNIGEKTFIEIIDSLDKDMEDYTHYIFNRTDFFTNTMKFEN